MSFNGIENYDCVCAKFEHCFYGFVRRSSEGYSPNEWSWCMMLPDSMEFALIPINKHPERTLTPGSIGILSKEMQNDRILQLTQETFDGVFKEHPPAKTEFVPFSLAKDDVDALFVDINLEKVE